MQMALRLCAEVEHSIVSGNRVIFPETLNFLRKDTCYEIEMVGGGIDLRTNGSKGLEIIAVGRYTADEKAYLLAFIKNFESDAQSVTADATDYGRMILLEGTLTEKSGDVGGTFRLRFGGYEL